MHRFGFAWLLLAATLAFAPGFARADDSAREVPGIQTSNSALMRRYAQPPLPGAATTWDTTWVGLSASNHAGPHNWWNLYTGVARPGTSNAANAIWDFEDLARVHGDSLQGWWPTIHSVDLNGVSGSDDHAYVYACRDFGNATNAVIPGGSGRTAGIVGAWHSDPGRDAGQGVTWTPISGSRSAWCGLREHGDLAVVDAITGNPYNQDVADFLVMNAAPSVKNFPGYVRQWDQMLYRDLVPVEGEPLTLSFLYRTWMSTAFTHGAGRRGWFHGDPLSTDAGNFISAAAQDGPVDSFQVWIGVPVNDDSVTYSLGNVAPVADPQRRWFSEVLRLFDGPSAPHWELLSRAGNNPPAPDTLGSVAFKTVLPWREVAAIVHSPLNRGGTLRLVFRVKTNDTGDDLTSPGWGELGGRGAAQVDDVTIRWGGGAASVIGDFEGAEGEPGNVNNAVGASAVAYWKSTGKPPGLAFHARPLAGLTWHDLCGPVGVPSRHCDMQGNVLDAGLDPTETIGDPAYEAGRMGIDGCLSPAIDLTTTESPNPMGITTAIAAASDDYYVTFDLYSGDFDWTLTGVFYGYGCASYPNVSAGTGTAQWGDLATSSTLFFDPEPHCMREMLPLKARNLVQCNTPTGRPDSLRIWVGVFNVPNRFAPNDATGWNPTDGAYVDNVSLAIVNKTGGSGDVGTVSAEIWNWFCDAFPVGTGVPLGSGTTVAALDTCGALVKGARNIAQLAAVAGLGGARLDVLADSIVIAAPDLVVAAGDTNSRHVRVDMVFRILPGVGNYRATRGLDTLPYYPPRTGMHVLRRPDDRATIADPSDPSDHSFWAEYMRAPGAFASGGHPLNPVSGLREWGHLVWNSARVDTLETNLFPAGDLTASFPVRPGFWQSTLHESDPHYAVLGIPRPRCFVVDTSRADDLSDDNVGCGAAPAWLQAVPRARSGWDGEVTTLEGTKVIPDGLLTPGAHVQYFFRKSQEFQHGGYAMLPDTSTILPQRGEWNFDAHRWQQFGVFPDRWKDWTFGGDGMASLLLVDADDRRGDEGVWVSVLDSTACSSDPRRFGGHNGWHAARDVVLDANRNPNLRAQAFVQKNVQNGTVQDLYAVRAVESGPTTGARPGARLALLGTDRLQGHDNQVAPTPDMLRQFYSLVVMPTGDLSRRILGPALDMPEDDVAMLTDFLNSNSGLVSKPRGLWVGGSGFGDSEFRDPLHDAFLTNQLGLSLVNTSYAELASNPDACASLSDVSPLASWRRFGLTMDCARTLDVFAYNPAKLGAKNTSFYPNTGAGPYAAAVVHLRTPSNNVENYLTLTNGFDLADVNDLGCSGTNGRLVYAYDVETDLLVSVCAGFACPCPAFGCGDVAPGPGPPAVNSLRVAHSLLRSGSATLTFGVAASGRVRVRLYDVAGRLVRTLADRMCSAGEEYVASWDGTDDAGRAAPRSVYFARFDDGRGGTLGGRIVLLR